MRDFMRATLIDTVGRPAVRRQASQKIRAGDEGDRRSELQLPAQPRSSVPRRGRCRVPGQRRSEEPRFDTAAGKACCCQAVRIGDSVVDQATEDELKIAALEVA